MSWDRLRWVVLAMVLGGVVWAMRDGLGRVWEIRRVDRICSATAAGQWQRAVEISDDLAIASPASRRGLECRCLALLELERIDAAGDELVAALDTDPGDTWLPAPVLSSVAVNHLRDRGELRLAANLAVRANQQHGDTPLLLMQEMLLRSQLEDEAVVLAEIAARLPTLGPEGNDIAFVVVRRYLLRQQWEQAAAILASTRPLPVQIDTWFELDTELRAALGDALGLRASIERWRERGGNPADLEARYAYLVSVKGLVDPAATHEELLAAAAAREDQIEDRELAAAVRARLIRYLAFLGRRDEALQLYDESVEKHGSMAGVTRSEIMPSASQQWVEAHGAGDAPRGTLIFRGDLEPGDTFWVSPDPVLAADAPFQAYPLDGSRRVKVTRTLGEAPTRWVLRDRLQAVVASGAVWPDPGRRREIRIERRAPGSRPRWSLPARRAVDGRRRLVLLVLDGADWRLVRYLQARQEVPVLAALVAQGIRGVLLSEPPFTAAALRAMVHPEPTGFSFPGLLLQLGEEVEALNFVGRNPVGFLEAVLPGSDDLFEALGRGELALANLLRSQGAIQAGRHAQIFGPAGQVRELSGYRSARLLTREELDRITGLAADPESSGPLLEEIAADFDTAVAVVEEGEVDALILRVAALDILTHAHYAPLLTSAQDDGDRTLLRIYSYIDSRLADLAAALDGDDVLILMSDHGIRNSLEHDPNCVFIAASEGLGQGRLQGRPALGGTGRMVADLFAVETGWPATGMESWIAGLDLLESEIR